MLDTPRRRWKTASVHKTATGEIGNFFFFILSNKYMYLIKQLIVLWKKARKKGQIRPKIFNEKVKEKEIP